MKIYTIKHSQFLPIDKATAWDFFSSPRNLARITPPSMNFKIHDEHKLSSIHEGQLITYQVTVLPLLRVKWKTKITDVQAPDYFIDHQLAGPYKRWIHKHSYHTVEGGIEMVDEVVYILPLGRLGQLAHALFVGREIKRIFEYRKDALMKIFPPGLS